MFKVMDLFSGAGGFSSGFKKAGYKVVVANELVAGIAETYIRNHKDTDMIVGDIKDFKEIVDKNKCIDVIIGGPPCQGFSMAGARNRINKKEVFLDDERNYLFRHYVDIVKDFKPKAFVIENVTGLVNMKSGDLFKEIISILTDETIMKVKYNIKWKVIDMSEFGIPQKRKRIFIVGIKESIFKNNFFDWLEDEKESITTVKGAIFDLMSENDDGTSHFLNHIKTSHNEVALSRMKKIKCGENFSSLENDDIKSVHSGSYGRMMWDRPSKTITTRFDTPSGGEFIHPELDRTITQREAARLQTFDDSYVFYGSKTLINTQIGNAVPPKMSYKIGQTLKKIIEEGYNE